MWKAALVAIGLMTIGLTASANTLEAQQIDLSAQLGWGDGTGGETGTLGGRLAVTDGRWGGYARATVRLVSQTCIPSLAPCGSMWDGPGEYAVGVTRMAALNDRWSGRLSVGSGIRASDDSHETLFETDAALLLRLGGPLALELGGRWLLIPWGERRGNVWSLDGVAGFSVVFGRE